MRLHLRGFLALVSAFICIAALVLWIRGNWARDGLWYSTDSMRYSVHSYRGRVWFWTLSIAPDPSAMVWGTKLRMGRGFQIDSVSDSWYAPYIGPSKGVRLETDFTDAPGGWSKPAREWLGFRYVREDAWYPRAQLMFGYPTARSRALFIPHWAIVIVAGILPVVVVTRFIRGRKRRGENLCPKCGYDLRATPGRCPECGTESITAQ